MIPTPSKKKNSQESAPFSSYFVNPSSLVTIEEATPREKKRGNLAKALPGFLRKRY